MKKLSAGVLLFRWRDGEVEVLLVHPGGPFWAKKDAGAWSIPKGEYVAGEDPLAAARREFAEETGFEVDGLFLPLGELKQRSGKIITAWALEHDINSVLMKSNTFSVEWPPRSGKIQEFPEVDAAEWFSLAGATQKVAPGQLEFLNRLRSILSDRLVRGPSRPATPGQVRP